jgi:hypothetical protein
VKFANRAAVDAKAFKLMAKDPNTYPVVCNRGCMREREGCCCRVEIDGRCDHHCRSVMVVAGLA